MKSCGTGRGRRRVLAALAVMSGAVLSMASAMAATGADPAPAKGAAAGGDGWSRVGVIVASQRGLPEDKPLRFAYQDGEKLARLLATVGQVEPDNLFLLKAENGDSLLAAAARAGRRIEALKRSGRRVFLQFYYTGHGAARHFHLGDAPLPFDAVKEALGGQRADARVYVLDVCYGASFFTAKGFRTAPPVQLQMEMDKSARGEVTISSSSMDEQAYEVRSLGGSIFTSHWVMALRGAGDRNRDGQVTLFEAYNYSYDRTAGYSAETLARPQHPSFQIDLTGARDMMLARLLRTSTGLLFRQCPAGRYSVLDLGRGHAIGELRVPEGEEFTLALEQGRYRVQYLPARGRPLSADVELPAAGMTPLAFSAFGPAESSEAGRKGPAEDLPAASQWPVATTAAAPGPAMARWRLETGLTLAASRDDELASGLRNRSPVDGYFGLGGEVEMPAFRMGWIFDLAYSPWRAGFMGVRLGLGHAGYSHRSEGLEPLESLADGESGNWPVKLSWDCEVQDVNLVLYAGRRFPVTPYQTLTLDLGGGWLRRSAEGRRVLERTLYQTRIVSTQDMEAHGYRLEAGIGYGILRRPGGSLFGFQYGLSVRLSPYFQAADERDPRPGLPALDSREAGASLSLLLSLGRPRPDSRSLP